MYGRGASSRPPPTSNNSYDRQNYNSRSQQFSTAQSTDNFSSNENSYDRRPPPNSDRRDPPNSDRRDPPYSSNDRRGPPPSSNNGYDRRPPPEGSDRRPPPPSRDDFDRQDRGRRFDDAMNGPDYRDFGRPQDTRGPPPQRNNDGAEFRYPRGPAASDRFTASRNSTSESNDVRQTRNNPPPRIIADPRNDSNDDWGSVAAARSPRPADNEQFGRSGGPGDRDQFSHSSGDRGYSQQQSTRGAMSSGQSAPPRAPYDVRTSEIDNRYSRDSRPDNSNYGSRSGGGYDSAPSQQRGGYNNAGPGRDQGYNNNAGRDQQGGYNERAGSDRYGNSGGGARRDQDDSAFSGRGSYAPRNEMNRTNDARNSYNDQDRGYGSRGQDNDRGYQSRGQDSRGPPPTRGGYGGAGRDQGGYSSSETTRGGYGGSSEVNRGPPPTRGGYNNGPGRDNNYNTPNDYGRPQFNDSSVRNPRDGAASGGYAPTRGAMSSGGSGYDRSSNNDYSQADRGYSNRGQQNGFSPSTRGGRAPYGGENERQIRPYNNQTDSSHDYSRRDGPPTNDGYGSSTRGGFMAPSSTRGSFGTGRGGSFNAGGSSRYEDRRDDSNSGYGGFGSGGNSGYGGLSGGGGYGGLGSTQFDADGRKIRTAENHAPRDYKPVERNVEDIFEEDKEDVKKNTATIFDADADVTVEEAADDMNCETWAEMNLHDSIMDNIRNSDYIKPRKIQARTIPYVLEGYDVKCQGETGSGKTAAFLIPVIQKLIELNEAGQLTKEGPICLIVAPTRELVSQIYEQALKFANKTGITVARAYGEYSMFQNRADIRRGCNILCACIGRLMHFVEDEVVKLDFLKFLILDEADRLLLERNNSDVMRLFNYNSLPDKENLQMLLFSATLRDPIVMELTQSYMKSDKCVLITATCQSNKRVNYKVFAVPSGPAKFKYLVKYMTKIKEENDGIVPRTLIFVNKKINTDRVAMELTMKGFASTTIHGDRGQHLREEALAHFRNGKTRCLIATDVCARGVDIKEMDHVINFDLPADKDGFIQRSGRTGRTHNGTAMSFYYESDDRSMATDIARIIQQNGQEAPEFLDSYVKESDYNFGEPEEEGDAAANEEDEGYQNGNSNNDNGYGSSSNNGYGGTPASPPAVATSEQPGSNQESSSTTAAATSNHTVEVSNDDDWD